MIRAAEQIGVQIPRFCDHPLLAPVGACRQCLVEVWAPRNGELASMGKPQASCTLAVADGMVVQDPGHLAGRRQGAAGRHGVPAGQPPARLPGLRQGRRVPAAEPGDVQRPRRVPVRRDGAKRTFPKPINISAQVLLDRERCVLCARCTRFSEQIAGDPFIALIERGALQQVGIYEKEPFESYFSGNTIQICPVGALTSASYRFRCPALRPGLHARRCASTAPPAARCAPTTVAARSPAGSPATTPRSTRSGTATRAASRSSTPARRTGSPRRWSATRRPASTGPRRGPRRSPSPRAACRRAAGTVGVLTGGRLTGEDAYAYSKFARVALGTNDIDFRARPHSAEEADFLASHVVGQGPRRHLRRPREGQRRGARRASSPRTSRRSCSCGCARPPARAAPGSSRSRRSPPAACRRCTAP